MTALLGVVALSDAATIAVPDFSAGIRSLGGFAPFGADLAEVPSARLWAARSFRGGAIARRNGCLLALDGRLRDGAAFRRAHGIEAGGSDAGALLRAYETVDLRLFDDLDADVALVLHDPARRRVVLYRDPLGERGLRFRRDGDRLCVSTRGSAILAMLGEPVVPNEVAMAHYFALRAPPDEVAWLEGVRELPSGGLCIFEDGRERMMRIAPKIPAEPLRFRSDDEAAEAWRAVVAAAVARATADVDRAAITLSGGIDSTLLASFLDPGRALAVSWALPELPECDEFDAAASSAAQLGLRHVRVPDGDYEPLADLRTWPMEDEMPGANGFRRLLQATFATARAAGADVLVSGHFGDHLYADPKDWPGSYWRERGLAALLLEFARGLRDEGFAFLRDPGLRGWMPVRRQARPPAWLTPSTAATLLPRPAMRGFDARIDAAYGRTRSDDADLGRRFADACSLELRFPYRDPALLGFALSLPAHYSFAMAGPKWLSRRTLRGRVPESVRLRPRSGLLGPLYRRGLVERHRAQVQSILFDRSALWPAYLREEWLRLALAQPESGAPHPAIWRALSFELWRRAHFGAGPAVLASRALSVESGSPCQATPMPP
jgi:asparagine synthase (glutamine-hydrolysing)